MLPRHFISAMCMVITLATLSDAEARTIQYSISGMFSDGASLKGRFTINWSNDTVTQYKITTTPGMLTNLGNFMYPIAGFTYASAQPMFENSSGPPAIWGINANAPSPNQGYNLIFYVKERNPCALSLVTGGNNGLYSTEGYAYGPPPGPGLRFLNSARINPLRRCK